MNSLDQSYQDHVFNVKDAPPNLPSLYERINSMKESTSSKISNEIELQYQDSQGLSYDISNEQDYQKALLNSSVSGSNILRFAIKEKPKENDPKVNNQELENFVQDFSKMPECAEKNLLTLHYISKLKQLDSFPNHLPLFNIQETFAKLKERITIECLQFSSLNTSLANCEALFTNEDWKLASQSIAKLLKEVRSLNIQEILRLVQKSQNSVNLAARQEIVLFFGTTGAGKSTTIHFLAGSEMEQEEGSDHIFPRKIHNQGLHKITTSASSKSETRYITSVTVNFSDIQGSCENGTIILCDAPGRNDTAGTEVDIANSVSIQRVVQNSKSVRPVFLISFKGQGDRLEGIKDLIHFLKEMIPETENHRKSLTFMFTKFPENKTKEIHASIKTLLKDMDVTERADKTYVAILEDMLEKTKPDELITIDPIEDKSPGYTLDKIAEARAIARPEEIFRFTMGEKSRGVLREQISQHRNVILKALERSDLELIKYKLAELMNLKELIEDEMIEKSLLSCFKDINDSIREGYKQASLKINTCMKEENCLSENEIQEYQKKFLELKALTDLIKEFNHEEDFDLVMNLEKQIENLLQSVEMKSFDDLILKSASEKLQLVSKYFPQFLESYEKANTIIKTSFDKACENYLQLFAHEKFQESEAELTKIRQFSLSSSTDYFTKKYQQLKEELATNVKSTIPKLIESVLNKYILTQEDIETIKSSLSRLESIKTAYIQGNHISKEEIESVRDSCAKKIQPSFERLVKNIEKQIESQGFECLSTLQESFIQLRLIRNIQLVEGRTAESYYQIIGKLRNITQEISRKVTENINPNNNNKINSIKISSLLRLLAKNQWIDDFEKELYSKTLSNIQEEVSKSYSHLKDTLNRLMHGPEIHKWIQEAYQILTIIQDMSCFEEVLPETKKERVEIISLFEEKINSYHGSVTQLLDKYQQSPNFSEFKFPEFEKQKLEKFLLYVKACEGIQRAAVKNSHLQENLEDFLRKYRDHLTKTFTECFYSIDEYRQSLISGNTEEPTDFPIQTISDLSASFISVNTEKRIKKVKEDVNALTECLRFVYETKSQYPSLYEMFDSQQKLLTQWQKMLIQELHDEITDNLNLLKTMQRIKSLKRMLELVKLLRSLDEFLPEKNEYRKLYSGYNGQVYEKAKEKKEDIIRAINAGEYENIQFLIDDFMADPEDEGNNHSEKNILNEIQVKLRQHVENFLEETRHAVNSLRMRENITFDKFDGIVKNLKKLRKISDYLSPWLEFQTLEDLKGFEPRMKRDIKDRLSEYLGSIKFFMDQFDFKKANEQKETLGIIIEILGLFCEEEIQIGFNELDTYEEEKLKELEEKYTDLKLTDYPGNNSPKKVFSKFLECVDTKPAVYQRVQDKMEEKILQAFEKELEQPNIKLKSVENYSENYLPEHLTGRVKLMLLECQDKIDAAENVFKASPIKKEQQQLNFIEENKLNEEPLKNSPLKSSPKQSPKLGGAAENTLKASPIKKEQQQLNFIEEKKLNEEPFKNSPSKQTLLYEIKELESTICENLLIKNIHIGIAQLTTLAQKYSQYMEQYQQEYQGDDDLDKTILKSFNQTLRAFLSHFKNPNTKTLNSKTIQTAQVDFACLMEFFDFQSSAEGVFILKEDHYKSFANALAKAQPMILMYFCAFQTEFDKTLEAFNIPEVNNQMQYLREIQPIISTIHKRASNNPNLAEFSASLNEIWTEKDMINILQKKMAKIEAEVRKADFLDYNELNSEASFNGFYERIRMKLLKLLEIQDYKELEIVGAKSIYEGLTKYLLEKKGLVYDIAKDCLKELFSVESKTFNEFECQKFLIHYENISSFEKSLMFSRSKAPPCNLKGLEDEFEGQLNNIISFIFESSNLEELMQMHYQFTILADNFIGIEALHSKVRLKTTRVLELMENLP